LAVSAVVKPSHDTLALADRMAALLKSAGFALRYVSMKSEACYYAWPGRNEVIRIATHRFGKNHGRPRDINGQIVVAKITLCGTHLMKPGQMNMAESKVRMIVAAAIGQYFLAAADIDAAQASAAQ
jgi:hypothetical protein